MIYEKQANGIIIRRQYKLFKKDEKFRFYVRKKDTIRNQIQYINVNEKGFTNWHKINEELFSCYKHFAHIQSKQFLPKSLL